MRSNKVSSRHGLNFPKKILLKTQVVRSPIRTCGEVFPDGAMIDLIQKAGILSFFVFDGENGSIVPETQFRNRLFRPAKFSRMIRRVVKFPTKAIPFGSTTRLFAAIQQLFTGHGFLEEVAAAAAYFIFATWCIEALPMAPCLVITGPWLEASLLLQLLRCLVRRSLLLGEVTRHGLRSLPMELRPTLLINAGQIGSATMELLRSSNLRNTFFPSKDGVMDLFCAKAVYCGVTGGSAILGESALDINLLPSQGRLSILDGKFGDQLADEFQSKLLAYRSHNFLEVRGSRFDLPEFTSATRILARVFGAPIVDAPALQAGLTRLLRDHEEKKLETSWTDLRRIVLEAILHHCHQECGEKVYVGGISKTVNGILKGRGESVQREAREIGPVLRGLGLITKRDSAGLAILLDSTLCRGIHQLAHGYGLLAIRKREAGCPQCHTLMEGTNALAGRALKAEKKHE
jgi:hypothetical protein